MERRKTENYRLDISGNMYKISRQTMLNVQGSKLADIATSHEKISYFGETIFFERPRRSFESILAYHQTGKLHLPQNVCPGEFLEELTFWKIDPEAMEMCCYHKYLEHVQEQDILSGFLKRHNEKKQMYKSIAIAKSNGFLNNSRMRVWTVLDNLDSSIASKVYFCIASLVIILAILAMALSTLPEVREFKEVEIINSSIVPEATLGQALQAPNLNYTLCNPHENDTNFCNFKLDVRLFPEKPMKKILLVEKAMVSINESNKYIWIFIYIEYSTNLFFTIELFLRLVCCPKTRKDIFSVRNIVDFVALLAVYLRTTLRLLMAEDYYEEIDILLYVQIIRIFRLLRVVENVTAFQVLTYSIKTDKKDLFVMIFYVSVGVLFFSNFVYFVEMNADFPSIPDAWWWSIITMTTVGYGDSVPKTVLGKIIGALCALSGVLLFSLIIPIFVNTFLTLYQFTNVIKTKPNNNINVNVEEDNQRDIG